MKKLVLALGLLLAACGGPPKPAITDARVNLPAVTGRPGAAYFTIKGGPKEMRLMSVTSSNVARIELHEMTMKDGMMSMDAIDAGVPVPPGGEVAFAPGGKHAMLFDINPKLKAGDNVKLSFVYADGLTLDAEAKILAPGDDGGHHH